MWRYLLAEDAESMGEEHHIPLVDLAVVQILIALVAATLFRFLNFYYPKTRYVPFSVFLFLLGLFFSGWATASASDSLFAESVREFQNVHPHFILFVLLPPLLFESAISIDFHVFNTIIGQALWLAFPMVFVAVGILSVFIRFGFPTEYGFDWPNSLLLASILSATDPVAVVAALSVLGAPKRLSAIIDGEALMNDGSAFVLFLIFADIARGEEFHFGEVILRFLALALGGPLWGLLNGFVLTKLLNIIVNLPIVEVSLIMISIFSTYYVGEALLHVSGVLAVVALGLYMARSGKYSISSSVEESFEVIMRQLSFYAEALIFYISGVVSFPKIFSNQPGFSGLGLSGKAWGILVLLYVVLFILRGAIISASMPLLSRTGYHVTWREAAFMVFGGLRGAVGLTLALLLEVEGESLPLQRHIAFFVVGIVLFTLVINGTFSEFVYHKLNIYPANPCRSDLFANAIKELETELMKPYINNVNQDFLYKYADKITLDEIIPSLNHLKLVDGKVDFSLIPNLNLSTIFHRYFSNEEERKHKQELYRIETSKPRKVRWGNRSESQSRNSESKKGKKSLSKNKLNNKDTELGSNPPFKHPAFGKKVSSHVKFRQLVKTNTIIIKSEEDGYEVDDDDSDYDDSSSSKQSPNEVDNSKLQSNLDLEEKEENKENEYQKDESKNDESKKDASKNDESKKEESKNDESKKDESMNEDIRKSNGKPAPKGINKGSGVSPRRGSTVRKLNSGRDRRRSIVMAKQMMKQRQNTFMYMRSIAATHTSEEEIATVVESVFNVLKSSYQNQYESAELDQYAIGPLLAASGVGADAFLNRYGNKDVENEEENSLKPCFKAEWENIESTFVTRSFLIDLLSKSQFFCKIPFIANLMFFERWTTAIEILSGYVRAHKAIIAVLDEEIPEELRFKSIETYLKFAERDLNQYKISSPRTFLVTQTVLTARYLLKVKKESVFHLFEEGLIRKSEFESIASFLDSRIRELSTVRFNFYIAQQAVHNSDLDAMFHGGDGNPEV